MTIDKLNNLHSIPGAPKGAFGPRELCRRGSSDHRRSSDRASGRVEIHTEINLKKINYFKITTSVAFKKPNKHLNFDQIDKTKFWIKKKHLNFDQIDKTKFWIKK